MTDQELEKLQKKAHVRFRLLYVFTGAVYLALLAFCIWYVREAQAGEPLVNRIAFVVIGPAVAALACACPFHFLVVRQAHQRFSLAYKNRYVLPTLEGTGYFEDLHYQPKGGLSYNEIRDSGVVACGEYKYYETEDLLTGRYQGIPFLYGDVKTQYLRRKAKRNEIRTLFQGQVMRFSAQGRSKRSFGHLQIFEKEFLSDLRGWTASNRIETEDEAFNRRFQVYAADSHNAFYILTPQMLQQITRLADLLKDQVAITFTGSSLYVAVSRTRSAFEPHVDEPVAQQRQYILEDVELMRQAGDLLILELETTQV